VKPSDKKRFAGCLLGCAEAYGKGVSDAALEVWWQCLAGADVEAVEGAFWRHLRSPDVGQFFPKPADILRMIDGTSLDASMVAWGKVDQALRRVGTYATVAFDDPLVHRCIADMGGWIELGKKTEAEWPFVGNEFRTRYKGYRSRGEAPDYPRRLMGITEAENAQRGYPPEAAVCIGDESRALAVMAGGSDAPALGIKRIPAKLHLLAAPK